MNAQQARNEMKRLATARARERGDSAPRFEDYRAVELERPDLAVRCAMLGW